MPLGCGTGTTFGAARVDNSRVAFRRLFGLIQAAIAEGEEVWIEITQPIR